MTYERHLPQTGRPPLAHGASLNLYRALAQARACSRGLIVASVIFLTCSAAATGDQEPRAGQDGRDDELSKRLVRKARTGTDEDVMATIIRLMDDAARKLEIEFDASADTQALQAEVLAQLDRAILQAAQQRRTRRKDQPTATSDKRRKTEDANRTKEDQASADARETDRRSSGSTDRGLTSTSADLVGGKLDDSRRSWGHLPRREREEITQGFGEDYLEQYREWIERYYRALQEAGE